LESQGVGANVTLSSNANDQVSSLRIQ